MKRGILLFLVLTLCVACTSSASAPGATATPSETGATPIGEILSHPERYIGKEVVVEGYDRGWDLLGEAGSGPPRTRSDRVVADPTGAIYYVPESSEVMGGLSLPPAWDQESETALRLKGRVERTESGQLYLLVSEGEVLQGLPDGIHLRVRRTGGFAGFDQELLVTGDGAATFVDRKEWWVVRFVLDPAEVRQVAETARRLGASEVGEPVPDGFHYTVMLQEGAKPFTVVLHEGRLSGAAQELLERLAKWFGRAMSGGPRPTPAMSAPGPVAAAVQALAARLNVPESAITVVSWEPVDWPDTSLGCPEPGMMYAQVITPGYRVVLEVEGKTYEAHTDRGGQRVAFCR